MPFVGMKKVGRIGDKRLGIGVEEVFSRAKLNRVRVEPLVYQYIRDVQEKNGEKKQREMQMAES